MRIGWLVDHHETAGGAELTAQEFAAAAPDGIEIIDCRPGAIAEADAYVVHNCVSYPAWTVESLEGKPVVKYVHDQWPHGSPTLRRYLLGHARLIFCSPLHRERFPWRGVHVGADIPPACCPDERTARGDNAGTGAVWLGQAGNVGKGVGQAVKWANDNRVALDFIGAGPYMPAPSEFVRPLGPVAPDEVAATLARYERFVFLPSQVEPFGRAVVEAWAAGCELVVNELIGAMWWINNSPRRLDRTACTDAFWREVEAACS